MKEPLIPVSPQAAEKVQAWLAERGTGSNHSILFAPGSVWATKRWPVSYWVDLSNFFIDREMTIILIGGAEDRQLADEIISKSGNTNMLNAAGEFSILESSELIRSAAMLVSGDTAPVHLAVATGTRVLSIFGPTVPEFGFAPTGKHDRIIGLDIDCRPCAIHGGEKCLLRHHDCMVKLTADEIYLAVEEMLEEVAGDKNN